MTNPNQPTVTEADSDLYRELIMLADTNYVRRQKGEPVIEGRDLIAAHREAAMAELRAENERLREALDRLAKLTPNSANAHTAQDLCLTVRAIAESAIAKVQHA